MSAEVLTVKSLCKTYPAFTLKNVSFSLEKGKITGFIGRNGAGKSTTLKALFHFLHPDSGEIRFFGDSITEHELAIKQRVGFVSGGIDYYTKKKIKTITAVTKAFYPTWDDAAYQKYLKLFALDENKTPSQLSAGMRVKYALALALSHNAELLILDEPTSGLDPISRDDLLDVLMALCDEGKTILFSTHITSDLDKCADQIIYIQNGQILADSSIQSFVQGYKTVTLTEKCPLEKEALLIGTKRSKNGYTALVKTQNVAALGLPCIDADLESIMIHLEKEVAE